MIQLAPIRPRLLFLARIIALCLLLWPAAACRSTAPAVSGGDAGKDGSGSGEAVTISVSGAFALFPLMTIWAEAYHDLQPDVTFDIQAGGAGKGMTDMLAGAADVAMLSRASHGRKSWNGVASSCR